MKRLIKTLFRLTFSLLCLPLYLFFRLLILVGSKDSVLSSFSQFLSLFPGKFGVYLRSAFYHFSLTHCDHNVVVSFGVLLSQQDTELYSGSYIGPQANIGRCKIEKNCLLGSGVHIMSGKGQHNFDDLDTPLKEQGGSFTKIVIGEDSWVGNGSLIMANIGKKCIVGAGAVVITDIPDYSIVAGNPAKIIKSRKPL